jgi:hypothetical protein
MRLKLAQPFPCVTRPFACHRQDQTVRFLLRLPLHKSNQFRRTGGSAGAAPTGGIDDRPGLPGEAEAGLPRLTRE